MNIGIFIEQGISKKTAPRILRKVFPEFEGAQLNVSYHKAWASVCKYIYPERGLTAIPVGETNSTPYEGNSESTGDT